MFTKNKYHCWYNQIVVRAKGRELDGYCERHHIKPKALGGNNDRSNIVCLTYREHFLAHWLLTKFTKGADRKKMLHALGRMCCVGKHQRVFASWRYALTKRAQRDAMLGSRMPEAQRLKMVGRKLSAEHCAKLSAKKRGVPKSVEYKVKLAEICRALGRTPEAKERLRQRNKTNKWKLGYKRTPEELAKLRATLKIHFDNLRAINPDGKAMSVETRQKISRAHMGKSISEETKAKHREHYAQLSLEEKAFRSQRTSKQMLGNKHRCKHIPVIGEVAYALS